ncbi:hypothetical protein SDC9_140827 [bioreactor metagenome]|uniref:Acyl-CoA thioesterase n=1 Tax=bioreactor metagenome TaxID=1076179 RepID=A0A645DWK8_9ZZZZ
MTKNINDIPELLNKFKHKTSNYVKFHEVDAFQVVHNLQYLLWAEIARVEYCTQLGISILPDKNKNEKPFSIFLVHTEINYFNPATFFDNYIMYTRVSKLGRSSMTFEHIVTKTDGTPLCINQGVEVYTDKNMQSVRINEDIRKKVIDFEQENLEITENN